MKIYGFKFFKGELLKKGSLALDLNPASFIKHHSCRKTEVLRNMLEGVFRTPSNKAFCVLSLDAVPLNGLCT